MWRGVLLLYSSVWLVTFQNGFWSLYWFVMFSTVQAVVLGGLAEAGNGTHPAVLAMQLMGTAALLVFVSSMDASLTSPRGSTCLRRC